MANWAFEEVEHTADWALRVRGRDLDELLGNAAWGMIHMMGLEAGTDLATARRVRLEAPDAESLLVAWLEELLYGIELRGVAYSEIEVHTQGGTCLTATVKEQPAVAIQRYIKAVTYHGLQIEESPEGLTARVVFDV
ncbi:MAG: archease [Chloroflexota bacterium]